MSLDINSYNSALHEIEAIDAQIDQIQEDQLDLRDPYYEERVIELQAQRAWLAKYIEQVDADA